MALVTLVEPAQEPVLLADMRNYLRLDDGDTDDDPLISGLISAARRWVEEYLQRRIVYQTLRLYLDFFPGYVDMRLAGEKVSSPFVSGSNAVLVGIRYAIALPLPPARAVVAFQFQDQNGGSQNMVAGTSYFEDLQSQPARLTPPFGQMWPVARVIANAINVDFICGYGGPVTVSVDPAVGGGLTLAGATFYPEDVGRAISIPGAGAAQATLSTTIASVANGIATLAAAAQTAAPNVSAWLGLPVPQLISVAIMLLVARWYESRLPDDSNVPQAVKSILGPYRDLRF